MSSSNVIMKKRNSANNGWDTILPITTAENVLINESQSVADFVATQSPLTAVQTTFGTQTVTEDLGNLGILVTTFNPDGTITEVLTLGEVVITKTTTFNPDGSITEEIL